MYRTVEVFSTFFLQVVFKLVPDDGFCKLNYVARNVAIYIDLQL